MRAGTVSATTSGSSVTLRPGKDVDGRVEYRVVMSDVDDGDPPVGEAVHWVRPELVAEIAFAEWTQNGLLRHPRFEGLRADKPPTAIHRERPRGVA